MDRKNWGPSLEDEKEGRTPSARRSRNPSARPKSSEHMREDAGGQAGATDQGTLKECSQGGGREVVYQEEWRSIQGSSHGTGSSMAGEVETAVGDPGDKTPPSASARGQAARDLACCVLGWSSHSVRYCG